MRSREHRSEGLDGVGSSPPSEAAKRGYVAYLDSSSFDPPTFEPSTWLRLELLT